MAESPTRSDMPDSASGDDLHPPQVVEDGAEPQPAGDAPEPWGGAPPWWSADSGDGTGPHMPPNGTGPQILPAPRDGTGPFRMPGPVNGSGAHPVLGTGPHGVPPGGSGAHPVVPGGTGPLPAVPGQALSGAAAPGTARRGRGPRLLLVAGAGVVAAVVLMAGALAFRAGGWEQDARTAAGAESKKVIAAGATAGGLHKDGLTSPQASAAYPFIVGAVEEGGVPIAEHGMAVYDDEPVRPVNVLFVGGTGPIADPSDFLEKAQPSTFIAGQDADAGKKGGKAVCGTFAVLAETHTFCAWATEDSFGVVASNRPTLNPQFPLMADVMRRIRNDVEKPK